MRSRTAVAVAAALALTSAPLVPTSATAAPDDRSAPQVATVAKGLVGPLSVAHAPDGTTYWADTFAGVLSRRSPDGAVSVVYQSRKAPPEAVSADDGTLRFATGDGKNTAGKIWALDDAGSPQLLADVYAHEKSANPDGHVTYGLLGASKACLRRLPEEVPGKYRGVKESHPYATAVADGITYVADAGANAILAVAAEGSVSTVAVLKAVKVRLTRAAADANGLPRCVVGKKFAFEAVPTDVEVGPDGQLYVSSLPGGPEDGSAGANGRVLRIDPATGATSTLVTGLVSPTGVAVTANGDVYVAQLFAGVISRVKSGSNKARPYLRVPLPAAVEATTTGLLATVNAMPGKRPKGKVVTIAP